MKEKLRSLLNDSMWSIAGLVLMNMAAQFLVYPFWNKMFGADGYGEIIYLISLMNIVSNTLGIACNFARITLSAKGETDNISYLVILAGSTILTVLYTGAVCLFSGSFSLPEAVCYILLGCLTVWRYYADIEYRLHLNFKGYFLYYLAIGIGYIIGTGLMYVTKIWSLALIPGELLGILMVLKSGSVFRKDTVLTKEMLMPSLKLFLLLCGSYFMNHLIFFSDRILIRIMVSSTAVSVYYLSSLFGKTMSLITAPFSGVISGHLARFQGKLPLKLMHIITICSIVTAIAAAGACTLGSWIVLPVLYPDTFEAAKDGFWICSIAQTIYFVSDVQSVVILRFAKSRFHVYMNAVYMILFIAACVPLTALYQLEGFQTGILIASVCRFLYGIGVGYYTVIQNQKEA